MDTGTRDLSVETIDMIQGQEHRIFRWLQRMSRLELAASVFFLAVDLPTRMENSSLEDVSAGTSLAALASVAALGVGWFASGLLFLRWIYRCIDSEGRIGERGYANRPGDIIWAYVIPFVNLVRPYEIIKRLAAASDPSELPAPPARETAATHYRGTPRVEQRDPEAWRQSFPLAAWWALWVIDSVITRIYNKLPDAPVAAESLNWVVMMTFVSGVMGAVKTGFFLRVISALQARRVERFERLRAIAFERSVDRRMGV